jgi:Predicted transcriptional regulators containing the CopG/Arc/MetJ DNA-binding domain and a metal-binding domain
MRTLVDIGDADLKALDRIAKAQNVSRASLIRNAVRDYLGRKADRPHTDAFGLWSGSEIDGIRFQDKIRCEW